MITFIKLGGSLITDKKIENHFRTDAAERIAAEIAAARKENPELQILLGHGSGSFGHVSAKRYGTIHGVHTQEEWHGFAEVAVVAAELNYLMAGTLSRAGVPVMRFQPSASTHCRDGVIISMAVEPIRQALEHGVVPLVYGDVALDEVRGGTITSTETVFFYLAQHIPVSRVLLLGEVDGVYDQDKVVIPEITPMTLQAVEASLGGSSGTDVTGGMETKVRDMVALSQRISNLHIRIMNGQTPGLLKRTLLDQTHAGTLIHAG